jgi:hypothetical protein
MRAAVTFKLATRTVRSLPFRLAGTAVAHGTAGSLSPKGRGLG